MLPWRFRKGRIAWSGPSERIPQGLEILPRLDCGGRAVLPGLIDAHTHLLFAGERSREFSLRMVGVSEPEAAMRAGGPDATAAATRALDADAFADVVVARLERMLEYGTTTVEAAAGYSIDYEGERDLLEIAAMVHRRQPVDLVHSFDVMDLPLLPADRPESHSTCLDRDLPRDRRSGACGQGVMWEGLTVLVRGLRVIAEGVVAWDAHPTPQRTIDSRRCAPASTRRGRCRC